MNKDNLYYDSMLNAWNEHEQSIFNPQEEQGLIISLDSVVMVKGCFKQYYRQYKIFE
jgi:hypothetical protein